VSALPINVLSATAIFSHVVRFLKLNTIVFVPVFAVERFVGGRIATRKTVKKRRTCLGDSFTCFGCATKTGIVRILVIFQDRIMFSLLIRQVTMRAFR